MSIQDLSGQLAIDVKGLNDLKREARGNSTAANKAVARQFEALFLQTVLKSMRDATPHDGIFDSEQTRMFESMHDQQLTQMLASKGRGTGLAALIEKQLARLNSDPQSLGDLPLTPPARAFPLPTGSVGMPLKPAAADMGAALAASNGAALQASTNAADGGGGGSGGGATREFVDRVWPHAFAASRATGIPAHFMVAQAALETGWGKSEPRLPDGSPSHNVFGIKAGRNWDGPVVSATTSEVVNGVTQRQVEQFRAYGSYAEAFRDYAALLTSSPRYARVVGTQDAAAFARGLQQAGYASDPLYASKLTRIIGGSALRNSLMQG